MNHKYNFLVIVSNHGMGTTYFCDQIRSFATNNLINIGEPFGSLFLNNISFSRFQFCAKHKNAIFDLNFKKNNKFNLNNNKLQYRFDFSLKRIIDHADPKKQKNIINLAKSLYWKKINDAEFHSKCSSLEDYFINLRKRIIKLSSVNEIILSHKIFPAYVDNDFDKVKSYLLKKDVLIVHLKRDYKNSRASNLRRLNRIDETDSDWDNYIETEILPNKEKHFQYDVENDLWKSKEKYQFEIQKILSKINNY